MSMKTEFTKVDYGQTYTLTFQNRKNSNVQFVKIDEHTGLPLKNAEIKLYKQSDELVGTITDSSGVAIVDDVTLADGWYKAVESKAPDGYAPDTTPQDFQLIGNQFVKLVFEDKKLQGITVQKLDSATKLPLGNVRFEFWSANGTSSTSVSSGTPAGYVVGHTPPTITV